MKIFLKKTLLNNVHLKIFSLTLGYICWSVISQSHTDDVWMEVPVGFYQTEQTVQIEAPETMHIRVAGKRSDLKKLDTTKTAAHINGKYLKEGDNTVVFSDTDIIVPEQIEVTEWAPKEIQVKVTKNQ